MAILEQGIGTVNFEVYLEGTSRLLGTANIELPTLELETIDMKGAGIGGTLTMPVRANFASQELKLTWRTVSSAEATAFKYEAVSLSLYGAQEYVDAATHAFKPRQHRVEVSCVPKALGLGKWEPSATVDSEQTFTVITLSYYIDGVEYIAFDQLNYIWRVRGTDYGEALRRSVGLLN